MSPLKIFVVQHGNTKPAMTNEIINPLMTQPTHKNTVTKGAIINL